MNFGGRKAGQAREPPTFVKGVGKKNMFNSRMNPLGAAPTDRKKNNRQQGRNTLKAFMRKRVSGSLLDMSKVTEQQNIGVNCNFNTKSFTDMVFDIIVSDFPPIDTLSIAGNSINKLEYLKVSAHAHRAHDLIRNLDLSDNRLTSFKELDHLKGFKLSEILLSGNPIASKEGYRREVITKLPTIELVDSVNLVALREQIKPNMPPISETFFFGPDTKEPIFAFCQKFFKSLDDQLFDTDLLEAYAPDCLFTLTKSRDLGIGYGTRAKQILDTMSMISHDLTKVPPPRIEQTVHKGRIASITTLKDKVYNGMSTLHDLNTFKVDTVKLSQGFAEPVIMLTVHGICKYSVQLTKSEKECSFERCFDRVMMLQAPPAGSNWPAIISNDMLHIRPHMPTPVQAPPANAPPDAEGAKKTALSKILASQTGLTHQYSIWLLESANWDPALAKQRLQSERDSLPAEAWQANVRSSQ
eukprot:TRINITY_DN6643_c0_g1_i1.p1 TRINITY_DN6643_c0_g1~~TRINITY_DN6643_c0_g1_i1.p1  ORF type:complete len:469 (+),score=84.17 TRINITY_DN6643_c0_g1_i1:223-1629(+)